MKVNSILAGFLLTLSIVSCKDDAKSQPESATPVEKAVVNPNVFSITLNAIVKKDDSFQVYYKEDEQAPFEEKNSLYVTFKGSDQPQDIIFNLPEDVMPNYIRLDYGINKEQSEIAIKNFKMSYLGKTIEAKDSLFFNYFIPNEEMMKVDRKNAILTPFVLKDGTYDPMSYTGEGLYKQIQLIAK